MAAFWLTLAVYFAVLAVLVVLYKRSGERKPNGRRYGTLTVRFKTPMRGKEPGALGSVERGNRAGKQHATPRQVSGNLATGPTVDAKS